jgi:hypothetical protein
VPGAGIWYLDTMSPGPIALVTGASGGLGEEFARLFAADGHDLVLVSRDAARLNALKDDLAARHGVRVDALPLDLSRPGAAESVRASLGPRAEEVGFLINNAGFGTFGPFASLDAATELAEIQLNVVTLTHLTRLFLPDMLARKRGRILNVASTAAFQAGPLMAVYYATKAYVLSFSEALANELKGSGVTVTCLCPGPTRTRFMERAGMGESRLYTSRAVMMEAAAVARKGYRALLKGRTLVIPGALNKLLAFSVRLGPRKASAAVVRSLLEGLRKPPPAP